MRPTTNCLPDGGLEMMFGAMADFSHLRATTADMIARFIAKGGRATDEMLLEASQRISPPLMPRMMLELLRTELDPKAQRRGRRRRGISRSALLVHRLEKLNRDDVPRLFADALLARLRSGEGILADPDVVRSLTMRRKKERNSLLQLVYQNFYDLLGDPTQGKLVHPLVEHIDMPTRGSRSARACKATVLALRWLGMDPPSPRTVMNLV
jgi:hypothetical protein